VPQEVGTGAEENDVHRIREDDGQARNVRFIESFTRSWIEDSCQLRTPLARNLLQGNTFLELAASLRLPISEDAAKDL